jgi:hypothetical protein
MGNVMSNMTCVTARVRIRRILFVSLSAILFFLAGDIFATAYAEVSLRKFPYPYRSVIAWMNDTDVLSPTKFEEVHRFLNTVEKNISGYGDGVGLDIGDSFWLMADRQDAGVAMHYGQRRKDGSWSVDNEHFVFRYLKAGWIDRMHSYASSINSERFAFTRADAVYLINWLRERGIHLDVWIDHGDNNSNVGTRWGHGKGSRPDAPEYHSDITFESDSKHGYGFRFVWIFSGREHRRISGKIKISDVSNETLSKVKIGDTIAIGTDRNNKPIQMRITEIDSSGKSLLGMISNLGRSSMLEYKTLIDSEHKIKAWEFSRRTYDRNGRIWYANLVDKQVSRETLDYLAENGLYEIFAIHLGYWGSPSGKGIERDIPQLLPEESIRAFRLVKAYQDDGKVLVVKGSRLLRYNLANDFLDYQVKVDASKTVIIINKINDPWLGAFVPTLNDLKGITFYCDNPANTDIYITDNKVPSQQIQQNPADLTGRKSIGIKWYEPDCTDYTRSDTNEKNLDH